MYLCQYNTYIYYIKVRTPFKYNNGDCLYRDKKIEK